MVARKYLQKIKRGVQQMIRHSRPLSRDKISLFYEFSKENSRKGTVTLARSPWVWQLQNGNDTH
jgi:hypothetical protein